MMMVKLNMKRVISAVMALIFVVSALPFTAQAKDRCGCGKLPVILLQGYSGSQLFLDLGLKTEKHVWGINNNGLDKKVIENIPKLALGLGCALAGNNDMIVKTVGVAAKEMFEPILMNDDGSSKHNISVYPSGAADTCYAALVQRGEEQYIAERPISDNFVKNVGADHVFTFTWDWRKGQVEIAKQLDSYIQDVKELTGHSKVNIYALSHGGQLGAAYLFYYADKGDVSKIVLNCPAIGGTSIVSDVFYNKDIQYDVKTTIEFAEIGLLTENEFEWIADAFNFDGFNKIVRELLDNYLISILVNFGSIWDFVPLEHYEELKKIYLDPVKNANIIAASDEMHYKVIANIGETLQNARALGIEVSIMSNTGRNLATGNQNNSDFIIDTASSSGAYCMQVGEKFADNYAQQNTVCKTKGHYHISPGRNIDASVAYLPDNTWFINGQFHGQSYCDDYSTALYLELLCTDNLKDVYSDPDFPQFEISQNKAEGIYAKFNNDCSGFVTSADNSITFKNISKEYDVSLCSIKTTASNLKFYIDKTMRLAPGESMKIPFSGKLPSGDATYMPLTFKYILYTTLPLLKSRTIDFTVFSDSFAASLDMSAAILCR